MNIAIFGSNSHIARGFIVNCSPYKNTKLFLFTGNPEQLTSFLSKQDIECPARLYSNLYCNKYDMIINCVGVGTEKQDYTRYFSVLSEYDDIAMQYLKEYPKCRYVFLSTGSIYMGDHSEPTTKEMQSKMNINTIKEHTYPSIVRLFLETKHRAFKQFNIADLRIYSYFSRHINLNDNYLICDIINAIKNKTVLKTNDMDVTRDYLHPLDFFHVIAGIAEKNNFNCAMDIGSLSPVNKFDIIKAFQKKYSLKYEVGEVGNVGTGEKMVYYPKVCDNKPFYSSMETIAMESDYLLKGVK